MSKENEVPQAGERYQVILNNLTSHSLHAQAHAYFEGAAPVVRVTITDGVEQKPAKRAWIDEETFKKCRDLKEKYRKELDDTRAVLGDLIEEKLKGLKVYVLCSSPPSLPDGVFLSLDAAKAQAPKGKWLKASNFPSEAWALTDPYARYLIFEREIL